MRTLLIAALSLSAFTPSRDADACGGYIREPRVLRLSTHHIPSFDEGAGTRSFVVLGTATPPATVAWRRLAPSSYDSTQIANDMVLANSVTLTLLGPAGTRVVSSTQHVFLSHTFDFRGATNALDIGNAHGFSIAIEGVHPNATWRALEKPLYRKAASSSTWVTALGVTPASVNEIDVRRITGTPFEAVSLYAKDSTKLVTFLRHGDKNLGRFDGSPVGTFTNNGITQLVLFDGANVSTAYLGDVRIGFGT